MQCGAPLQSGAGPWSRPGSPGLIIDFDDLRPPRGPGGRVAAAAGLGLAIVGAGLWLALSSAGASSSSPSRAPQAPAAAESAPPSPQPAPRRVSTPAKVALLSLDAVPWGSVYVDGRPVGTTPVVDVPLAPGVHHVRVERTGYRPYERVLDAAPGQRLRIGGVALQER